MASRGEARVSGEKSVAVARREPVTVVGWIPGALIGGLGAGILAMRFGQDMTQTQIAEVIGISRDSVASRDKFKEKYRLPFPLASDQDGKVCQAYGVWVERSMYGRKYMGIERASS